MPPRITPPTTIIELSPLAQDVTFLILAIAISSLILWAYHITHFTHSQTSKGIQDELQSIQRRLLELEKKN